MADEEAPAVATPPPGVSPLMMSMKMMDTYELKTGPGLKDTVAFKYFDKEFALKEVTDIGFYSAFHPFKKQLEKYPYPEILVMADFDELYGENWMICLTPEAFDLEKKKMEDASAAEAEAKRIAEEEAEAARIALEEEQNRVYEDLPLIPRPYVSETLEATNEEVRRLTPTTTRPLCQMKITRRRSNFGARYAFSDKEMDGPAAEFRLRRAPEYSLTRSVMDVCLQDTPGCMSGHVDAVTQTSWNRKINSAVQSEPEALLEASQVSLSVDMATETESRDDALQAFLSSVLPTCEYALQQNETLNIFQDELALLDEDDVMVVGNKGENAMRTLINFMDLAFSNNKSLVALDWHPKNRQWLATSAVEDLVFGTRLLKSGKATRSFVLVYTFTEFSAQIVLESPEDVFCFRWNPYDSDIIACGCATGQVLLYDLKEAMQSLSRHKSKESKSGDSESKSDKTIRVKHTYMSTIDHSHTRPVAEIHWLPPSHQISSRQRFVPSDDEHSYQFISGAPDGQVLVWDTQFTEKSKAARSAGGSGAGSREPAETPWTPTYRCQLRAGGQGKCGIVSMCFNTETPSDPLYCTTEDGLFVVADWAPPGQGTGFEKAGVAPPAATEEVGDGDVDTSAPGAGQFRVLWTAPDHQRPTKALQRSPFFDNLLLSVGDWGFTLWQEGMQQPLFRSPASAVPVMCGRWSPTRPSVIFVGKADGSLDIWDLVDQTHKPAMTKAVVSLPITTMEFRSASLSRTQQLLAVGDAKGTMHIIDIPVSLRKPAATDQTLMAAHLQREVSRVTYFETRRGVRAEEMVKKEAAAEAAERRQAQEEAALEAEIAAATANLAEGEELNMEALELKKQQQRAAQEELAYQALEKSIMMELGLDPDTYVVTEGKRAEDEGEEEKDEDAPTAERRKDSTAHLDSIKIDMAASGATSLPVS